MELSIRNINISGETEELSLLTFLLIKHFLYLGAEISQLLILKMLGGG